MAVHRARREGHDDVGERTFVVSTITVTKMAEMTIARQTSPARHDVAEQRSTSSPRKSACRSRRRCDQRDAAHPRRQAALDQPVPCSTLEAIIAPNIQLAGNLARRSRQRAAWRQAAARRV